MTIVLVTGGAGYLGSSVLAPLKLAGYQPVVFDNLSRGFSQLVLQHNVPPALVADAAKARQLLHWQPHYSDLERIVRDALSWEQQRQRVPGLGRLVTA